MKGFEILKAPNITSGVWNKNHHFPDCIIVGPVTTTAPHQHTAFKVCKVLDGDDRIKAANARAISALPEVLKALADAFVAMSRLDGMDVAHIVSDEVDQAKRALFLAGYEFPGSL